MEYTVTFYTRHALMTSRTFYTRKDAIDFICTMASKGYVLMNIEATETVRHTVSISEEMLRDDDTIVKKPNE